MVPQEPFGSLDAEALKVTDKGALPESGFAERTAIGILFEQLILPTRLYDPVVPVVCTVSRNPAPAPTRRKVLPPILER